MDAYTGFAQVYDMFMDETPYDEWTQFLCKYLRRSGIADGLLLDLGCGTGAMTRRMREAGYDMIGVDNSMEMLELAREQDCDGILYLQQDMREFELYGTIRAIYSACDSLNYLLEPEDLLQVFRLAGNYLDAGGLFLFDMKTPYTYETLLGDCTMADNRENASLIWENYYDDETKINAYDLTIFAREESGYFVRYTETHEQRAYTLAQVKDLLQQAGLEFVAAYDGYRDAPLREDSERMLIVAREQHTAGKLYV